MESRNTKQIVLCTYDSCWPELFVREAARIRSALSNTVILLEHVGSTSVPGLAAKPIIDILIEVSDSRDESAYVPLLERYGYKFMIREPAWFEHRLFKRSDPDVNLHVFSASCEESLRMISFRDHLRRNNFDRDLYERTKRALASRTWPSVQAYADAKSTVVAEIIERALRPTLTSKE